MPRTTQVSDDSVALAIHVVNPGSGLGYTLGFVFLRQGLL